MLSNKKIDNGKVFDWGLTSVEYAKENIGSGRVMQKIGMTEIPVEKSLTYQVRNVTEVDGIPIICYKLTRKNGKNYDKLYHRTTNEIIYIIGLKLVEVLGLLKKSQDF